MKLTITMKTPDAVEYAINEAIDRIDARRNFLGENPMDDDERYNYKEKFKGTCERWFRHGECATIEIDTEIVEATVLKVDSL